MTDTTTDEDPRVEAIASALEQHSTDWIRLNGEETSIDLTLAATIALTALGDRYCNEQCHSDEYNALTEIIREYEPRGRATDCPCRDEILAKIESE